MDIAALGTATGVVTAFDDDRGLGVITDDAGDRIPFHCTAIADGSRSIAAGTAITFVRMAGRLGRWEAGQIS